MLLLYAGLFLFLWLGPSSAAPLDLLVPINEKTGAYEIHLVNYSLQFASAETRLGEWNSADQSLILSQVSHSNGTNTFGGFLSTTLSWISKDNPNIVMETSVLKYPDNPSIITMEQYFPRLYNNSFHDLRATTLFPSLKRQPALACLSMHDVFPKLRYGHMSDYKESRLGGSPLIVYNETDSRLPTLVISPLDWPMAHQVATTDTMIGMGIKSSVTEIPAEWTQRFILVAAEGIHYAVEAWGSALRKWHNNTEPRSNLLYRDTVHSTIGFWTDNGGYYHYSTGRGHKPYEKALPLVKKYHDSIGVPFQHWQLDSWWYPKDAKTELSGAGGAVTSWTAMPSIFSKGMAAFQKDIGKPFVLHNRHWSMHSVYMEEGWDDIVWYSGPGAAIPEDPAKFFTRFFTMQPGWNLSMYEQDWMGEQYDLTDVLQTNISMGDLWLKGMAIGAASQNLSIQYCMAYPNNILSAAAYPEVTNARPSADYGPSSDHWTIGGSSLVFWALGILPFKDIFYSSNVREVGGASNGPEYRPDLEALISTLSCAMVAVADGIHFVNKTRVMQTCRADGVILKPDKPLATSEACFYRADGAIHHDPNKCYTYLTYSDVPGLGRVTYLFNNDTHTITPAMAHLDSPRGYVIYNWYTRELGTMKETNDVTPGYEKHSYAIITPVLANNWVFLGEIDKFVPASTKRFGEVSVVDGELRVAVDGVSGEHVRLCAARASDWKSVCERLHFNESKRRVVTFQADMFDYTSEATDPQNIFGFLKWGFLVAFSALVIEHYLL